MLDEVIIGETPPLYSCYCRIGEHCRVPVTGDRQKRILPGVINVRSGDVRLLITKVWDELNFQPANLASSVCVRLLITKVWDELTQQYCLRLLRAHWRGWHIILCEDRGTPHTAEESREYAAWLGIEVRLLPRATPELNAMDHLWRSVKGRALANRPTLTIDKSADAACRYILDMSRRERLRKAGVLSGNFWLTS
jgi:transposase